MKEMVKVYLYNNGHISIEPTKSFSAIQKINFKYPEVEENKAVIYCKYCGSTYLVGAVRENSQY